jgi:hypothetical protein
MRIEVRQYEIDKDSGVKLLGMYDDENVEVRQME